MPFLEFEAQSQRWLPRAVKKQTAGRGGGSASESGAAGGVQEPRGAERASGRGTAAGDARASAPPPRDEAATGARSPTGGSRARKRTPSQASTLVGICYAAMENLTQPCSEIYF